MTKQNDNQKRKYQPAHKPIYHGPAVTKLSAYPPAKVRWLWPDRLALGKFTLLAGDPGLGKSYLTLDLAARVSSGQPFPGTEQSQGQNGQNVNQNKGFRGYGNMPRKVILLSAEDDPADTIRPRLDAAGADCDNILLMHGVRLGDKERPVNLSKDVGQLEELIQHCQGECRLIVIDPISAYLGDDEGHSNTKVRNFLAPITKLAQDYHLAILAVTHLNKGSGNGGPQNAIYRTMGSLAFPAAARAVHLVARDPADHPSHGGTGRRRLLLPVKNNLGGDLNGWGFSLATHEFADPSGGDPDDYPDGRRRETKIMWDTHPTQDTADALLQKIQHQSAPSSPRPTPAMDEAVAFLQDALAEQGKPVNELSAQAQALGISMATLKRARHEAGVLVTREGGRHGRWVWCLDHSHKAKEITASDGLLYAPPPSSLEKATSSGKAADSGMG